MVRCLFQAKDDSEWERYELRNDDILDFLHISRPSSSPSSSSSSYGNSDRSAADIDASLNSQPSVVSPPTLLNEIPQSNNEKVAHKDIGESVNSAEEAPPKISAESVATGEAEGKSDAWFITDPPDPRRHLAPPPVNLRSTQGTLKECEREYRPVDLKQLYSYWVSVATKAGESVTSLVFTC